jgi:uncharacterized protein YcbK (DUF882 family)
LLLGCQSLQDAVADGDTRTITMHHLHTRENITVTFKRNGRYDEAALKQINWFLRDWRHDRETRMDPRLIDLVWEVYRDVGGSQPIAIICGYRDESTNSMLRRRSSGVAKNSLHMTGRAMDFAIPGVALDKLRAAGLRLQRGGVGFYPSSGSPFVHMDIGGVRHWPRMTREQLVRVFPNGRTVHIPTDGKPLAGYALALADIERRGSHPSRVSMAAANNAGIDTESPAITPRSLLASIFGTHDSDEAEDSKPTPAPASVRVAAAPRIAAPPKIAAAPVPLPKVRPAGAPITVAMAQPAPAPVAMPPKALVVPPSIYAKAEAIASSASPTPNEIIRNRGYWVGLPDMGLATVTSLTHVANVAAVYGADPITTGGILREWRTPALEHAAQRFAYAPEPERDAPVARKPLRTVVMRAPNAAVSIAVKSGGAKSTLPAPVYDPWLNAITTTPSVRAYLSATQYGVRDPRSLRPYFEKPAATVAMTFSHDPHHGMSAEHFSGKAIVFIGTVAFAGQFAEPSGRTASLAFPATP